jgi:hypothetical protein
VTVLVVVSAGLLDMTRPSDSQTHLGRLFVRIRDDGWDAFATVIARKADANLRVLTMSPWVLFVPLFLVLFIVVLVRVPRSLQPLFARCAHLRSALIATAVLAGAGGILNDSGIAIPGMILCVTTSVMAFLLARIPRTEPALAASVEREVAAV